MASILSEANRQLILKSMEEYCCPDCSNNAFNCVCVYLTDQERADKYYAQLKARLDERAPA